ncbi:MAG: heterodisulfide reductase-related iron-sulfur binding cluster [Desulfitobacteriia bacterium]|jgi:Fe-S oxidoreductase
MRIFIFFILAFISFSYFFYEIYKRIKFIRLGRPENRRGHHWKRWQRLLQTIFLQKNIAKYPLSGILHAFIMWGFIVLVLSSLDMASIFLFAKNLPILDSPVFVFLRDFFSLLVLIGVFGFTLRRLILKYKKQNWIHSSYRDYGILFMIFGIVITELVFFTCQALLIEPALPTSWFVLILTQAFAGLNTFSLLIIRETSWWLHYLIIFSFLFIIPNSKHLHLVFAPFNVYWQSFQTKGALQASLNEKNDRLDGVETVRDFTWKQLLDTFSCVLCGRCHRQCPSERSKERLKPKRINGFIRSYLEDEGWNLLKKKTARQVAGDLFYYDFIWSCTTCHGCNDSCPLKIDHLSKIIDMRRNIVAKDKDVPEAMKKVFVNINKHGNPYSEKNLSKSWVEELELPSIIENPSAEYLLFIGCQGGIDNSNRKIIKSLTRILKEAKVDFAVLGEKEWCCGETVRRMGNERLFQETVHKNIDLFKAHGIKKIITPCPHCFNTFKNEYPQYGGSYEVIPHTLFLFNLWREGRLKLPSNLNINVVYHDPCYLGRYNNIFEEPREVLAAIPGVTLLEMQNRKESSFCCGAGGGRFWTREEKDNPISTKRVKEALETEASLIVSSCPYCRTIFKEKLQQLGKNHLPVLDLAELLEPGTD